MEVGKYMFIVYTQQNREIWIGSRYNNFIFYTEGFLYNPYSRMKKTLKVNEHEKTLHGSILNGGSYTVGVL